MKHKRALGILILSDFVLTILGIVVERDGGETRVHHRLSRRGREELGHRSGEGEERSGFLRRPAQETGRDLQDRPGSGLRRRHVERRVLGRLVGRERSKIVAAVASHSGPLGLQTLFGVNAERKFPALIVHGDKDRVLSVAFARENRDKYKREGHEVMYVELKGVGHMWGTKADINETIWKFFADRPLRRKYEPSGGDQR